MSTNGKRKKDNTQNMLSMTEEPNITQQHDDKIPTDSYTNDDTQQQPYHKPQLVFVGSHTVEACASCRQDTTRTSGSMALSQSAESSLGLVWEDRTYSSKVSYQQPRSPQSTFTPQTPTQAKSWRSDAPIILPGWEHHTGGSRLTPTVHPCPLRRGGCGWLVTATQHLTK